MPNLIEDRITSELPKIQQEIGKHLGENLGIGVLVTNPQGVCIWVSPYLSNLLDIDAHQLYGTEWTTIVEEKGLAAIETNWYDGNSTLKRDCLECPLKARKGGQERWIKIKISPYPINGCDTKNIDGFIFLIEDVTLTRIKDKELYLQADLLSEVNDAVIVLDVERRVKYWNSGAERLYKIKADAMVGKKLSEAFEYKWGRPERKQKVKDELWNKGFNRSELIHIRKDGTKIHVEVSMHLNYDKYLFRIKYNLFLGPKDGSKIKKNKINRKGTYRVGNRL